MSYYMRRLGVGYITQVIEGVFVYRDREGFLRPSLSQAIEPVRTLRYLADDNSLVGLQLIVEEVTFG